MLPVRRRLLNLLTLLSLLLCVAVVALWVRSYFRYDILSIHPGNAWLSCRVRLGEVNILFAWDRSKLISRRGFTTTRITERARWTHAALNGANGWQRFGFGYGTQPFPPPSAGAGPVHTVFHVLLIPCWALVAGSVLFALLPAGRAWRRLRRSTPGLCARCGYDLRATPGRCPECGEQPSPVAKVSLV